MERRKNKKKQSDARCMGLSTWKICLILLCITFSALAIIPKIFAIMERDKTGGQSARNHFSGNHLDVDSPKVLLVTAQNRMSNEWCTTVTSGSLSNASVTTLFHKKSRMFASRWGWLNEFIEKGKFRDEDIVFFFDGEDTLINGAGALQRSVRHFKATTAASPAAFDGEAVLRGEATAPIFFSAESGCFHPQAHFTKLFPKRGNVCQELYAHMWSTGRTPGLALRRGADTETAPIDTVFRYLNAGGFVARVWAFKKGFQGFLKYVTSYKKTTCDQSVWGMLYLWSVTRETRVHPSLLLPYGLINIDYYNTIFLPLYDLEFGKTIFTRDRAYIADVVSRGELPFPSFLQLPKRPDASPAFLHFNGHRSISLIFKQTIQAHLSWVHEANRTNATLSRVLEMLEYKSLVDVYERKSGVRRFHPYKEVCSVDYLIKNLFPYRHV